MKNISITDSHKVVLHARLHEVRAGNGGTINLQDFSLENVSITSASKGTAAYRSKEDCFVIIANKTVLFRQDLIGYFGHM